MNPVKILLLCISMFIVLFLLFAALYDFIRCIIDPEAYFYSITSQHIQGSPLWFWDLFKPNLAVLLFCIPMLYIMKKYASAGEKKSVWNTAFYFAFVIIIVAGTLSFIEIFDTPDIEIIQNV